MKNSTLNILKAHQQRTIQKSKHAITSGSLPKKENPLIGASSNELNDKNAFLNRIGQLAYPIQPPPSAEPIKEKEMFSSKHFFVLPSDYAKTNKNSTGIESLPEEPFNIEILEKTDKYKTDVGVPVKSNIEIVSDFILNELTPLLLGLDGGITQARSVIHNTVADIDPYPFTALELLTREAVKIKIGTFIKTYFDLTDIEVDELVSKIMPPKQREVVVPVPMEGSRYENRTRQTRRSAEDKSG